MNAESNSDPGPTRDPAPPFAEAAASSDSGLIKIVPKSLASALERGSQRPNRAGVDQASQERERALVRAIRSAALERTEPPQEAVKQLFDAWVAPLHSIALERGLQFADAQDVTSDAFRCFFEKIENYQESKAGPFTWICAILKKCILMRQRKLRTKAFACKSLDDQRTKPQQSPEIIPGERLDESARGEKLRKAFDQLPFQQQQLLEMAYLRGLTRDEMASLLGVPVGTVKSQLAKAVANLMEKLWDLSRRRSS